MQPWDSEKRENPIQLDGCKRDAKKLQHAVTTSLICRTLAVDKIVSTLSSLRSISPKSIHKHRVSKTTFNIFVLYIFLIELQYIPSKKFTLRTVCT